MVGFLLVTWGATLLGSYAPTITQQHGSVAAIPALLCWFTAVVSMFAANACFKCSECKTPLHRAKGQHCPECGGRPLIDGDWWQPRRCGKCGLELHYGKGGRTFKVCYCSECGSHLHEKGL